MDRIITIGREFGSGGRELGRRLAENLGYAYYDQEILEEIASRTELSEKYVQSIVERRPMFSYPIHVGHSFHPVINPAQDFGQKIYLEQCNILRELAEKSGCVIVGRCADYILKDCNPFRVFVYADMDSKIERCRRKGKGQENLTDKEMKKYILDVDKHRARYYEFYTDQKWGDRKNYDICVNTTNEDIKKIANILARLFKA